MVRQALATLVAEGLVERGRGRGSVVAPTREHHRLVQRPSGLYQQMGAEGLRVTTEVLELVEEDLPVEDAWLGGSRVLRLERLRRVEGRPLARIRTRLPLERCAGLTAAELTDASLHEVLSARFGARPTGGRRQVRAVAADADLAAELGTAPGAPLLLLEGQTVDQHGRPLEVFATWHRAEEMAFDVEVVEQPGAPDCGDPVTAPSLGGSSGVATATEDPLREAAAQARRLADLLTGLTATDPQPGPGA